MHHRLRARRHILMLDAESVLLAIRWMVGKTANHEKRVILFTNKHFCVVSAKKRWGSRSASSSVWRCVASYLPVSGINLELFYTLSANSLANGPFKYIYIYISWLGWDWQTAPSRSTHAIYNTFKIRYVGKLRSKLVTEEPDRLLAQLAVWKFEKASEGLAWLRSIYSHQVRVEFLRSKSERKTDANKDESPTIATKRVPTTPHSIFLERTMYLIAFDLFNHRNYDVATGLIDAFNYYMRIGNLFQLTVNGIIFMDDLPNAYLIMIALELTRTARLKWALLKSCFWPDWLRD